MHDSVIPLQKRQDAFELANELIYLDEPSDFEHEECSIENVQHFIDIFYVVLNGNSNSNVFDEICSIFYECYKQVLIPENLSKRLNESDPICALTWLLRNDSNSEEWQPADIDSLVSVNGTGLSIELLKKDLCQTLKRFDAKYLFYSRIWDFIDRVIGAFGSEVAEKIEDAMKTDLNNYIHDESNDLNDRLDWINKLFSEYELAGRAAIYQEEVSDNIANQETSKLFSKYYFLF